MCEACKAARARAFADLIAAWKPSDNPGAQLIARLLALGEDDARAPADRQEGVNQLMLDSWEAQRRDAISVSSSAIVSLTMIKSRLLDEASRAGDKRVVNLQWDGEKQGYHLTGKDQYGNAVARFEPVAFGETPADAFTRIALGHLQSIDEVHE